MSGRGLVVVFVVCGLMATALAGCGHPAIGEKVVGWWQEVGTIPTYKMHITRLSDGTYQVSYPRSFRVPFDAGLQDDQLDIWGENGNDVVYRITYDAQTGRLKAVNRLNGATYTLKRIAP